MKDFQKMRYFWPKSYALIILCDNELNYSPNVTVNSTRKTYTFDYPCPQPFECTEYVIKFQPGFYKFELYGASGGAAEGKVSLFIDENGDCIHDKIVQIAHGNAKCNFVGSRGGAGGYISGIIKLPHPITAFATIGGRGTYDITEKKSSFEESKMIKGGYGGGGYAFNFYFNDSDWGSGSGGGQTAVKFESNDLWHRVIVSGAGGGSDNSFTFDNWVDDGSGGAGGGFTAQGWWKEHVLNSDKVANSTFGFTFGSGESARKEGSKNPDGIQDSNDFSDRPGAGGGWFGGFAGHYSNAGSGGGSSWALSADAVFPKGDIYANGSFYNESESHPYAFSLEDAYVFTDVQTFPGVWEGNGRLVITILDSIVYPSC